MAVDLVIDIDNEPGALARVAAAISDAGVNIAAATCLGGGEHAEMHILVTRFRGANEGLRFLDSLYQDPTHDVVFVDRDLERSATDRWLRKCRDHPLSLADAASFEVMRSRRIRKALALDEHFGLAGFERVP